MKSRSLSIILSVLFFSQVYSSQYCAKLADVSCGEYHTLAVDNHNNLWACGSGGYAMGLGNDASNILSLQRVLDGEMNTISGFAENVISFDAGWEHSLIVTQNGYCWATGDDSYGKLGNGLNEGSSNVPIRVHGLNNDANGLKNIVTISAGRSGQHSLAVDSNGFTYAWGLNDYKQCTGNDYEYQSPILVRSTGTDPNYTYLGQEVFIVDIEAGVHHSLALQDLFDGGHVYEWGNGVARPSKVPDQNNTGYLSNIIDIATCDHSLAVELYNGYVWYWTTGTNPTRIVGENGTGYLQNIVKVAAGSGYKCVALDSSGSVWEWCGRYGQPAKVTDGNMFTQTSYLENIRAIDAGWNDFRVAIDEYGIGWAWGNDARYYGGIGGVYTSEPVEMLCAEITSPFILTKTDDAIGCIMPYDGQTDKIINYTICVDANGFTDSNVVLIDTLPSELDFISCDSNGLYDSETRTVIWDINTMTDDYNDCFHLQVKLNVNSTGKYLIANTVELLGDRYMAQKIKDSQICSIVYVDIDAPDDGNGLSWDTAYNDLQIALNAVRNGEHTNCNQIWVADGNYYPTNNANNHSATFQMIPDIAMYGHFQGGCETDQTQRNLADSNFASILNGDVNNDGTIDVNAVVTVANNTILDGFTIRKGGRSSTGANAGIYCNNVSTTIANCLIRENQYKPIYCNMTTTDANRTATISNSFIENNQDTGIYCSTSASTNNHYLNMLIDHCTIKNNTTGIQSSYFTDLQITNSVIANNTTGISTSGKKLTLANCNINDNTTNGIRTSTGILQVSIKNNYIYSNNGYGISLQGAPSSDIAYNEISDNNNCGIYINNNSPVIRNNLIHHNALNYSSSTGGIYIYCGSSDIRNNIICANHGFGIYRHNDGTANIRFNIIRDNQLASIYVYGPPPSLSVTYNCLTYTYNYYSYESSSYHNIFSDPCFVSANDYHLKKFSRCIDAGDSSFQISETDTDGEDRILDGNRDNTARIDIGADEFNPYDVYFDNVTNFQDLAKFAQSWKMSNVTGIADYNDFYDDGATDYINYKDSVLSHYKLNKDSWL